MATTNKTQANSLRQNIANTGGAILRAISAVSPALGGAAGKAVDVIGKATGNYFPETGASEAAQSAGGYAKMVSIQQDPNLSAEQKQTALQKLEQQSGGSAISTGNSATNLNPDLGYNSDWRAEALRQGKDVNAPEFEKFRQVEASINASNPPERSSQDVFDTAKGIPGAEEFLGEGDLQSIMDKWQSGAIGSTEDLARQIEAAATENADREYNTVLEALGVQKGEINTLATQQKGRLGEEKKFTEEGFIEKEKTESEKIEGEKETFRQETEATKEELATNWRDLSLEMQRVMRARGVSDSAFASSQDAKLMLDFNKGLRNIAVKSTAAYQDFADAVIETNKYYTRERAKLDMDYNNAITDIDNWVRQNVQSIQAQENTALNKKLADIKNAILQGNQLRIQTQQKIEDQKLGLAVWMAQFQAQLKASVATAAAGKTDDAWKNIAAVRQNTDIIKTVLENGGEFVSKAGENGQTQWFVHGPAINADGSFDYVDLPVTEGYVQTTTLKTASQISGGSDMFSGMTGGKPSFESAYGAIAPEGLTAVPSAMLTR